MMPKKEKNIFNQPALVQVPAELSASYDLGQVSTLTSLGLTSLA